MKECALCKEEKPLTAFYKCSGRPHAYCKACHSTQGKAHYLNAADKKRDTYLRQTFGISSADYEQMLAAQDGVCWICKHPPRKRRLAVDHNHKTGKIRGLLCNRCNHRLLPAARENTEILLRAADYLKQNN